jgi:hypothetical protein
MVGANASAPPALRAQRSGRVGPGLINFLDNFFLKRRFAIPLIAGVLVLAVINEVNYRRAHSTLVAALR